MPVHDWTKVSHGIFHDFHNAWIVETKKVLNSGVLPPDYYALSEQVAGQTVPDVITLEIVPEVGGRRRREGRIDAGTGTSTLLPPPRTSIVARTEDLSYASLRKTVVIRHVEDHTVVALIEILSRSNKASRAQLDLFLTKALSALRQNIHLLVIDPYPPGRLDPQGIHGLIWAALGQAPTELPGERPLLAVSYEAAPEVTAYVEPFRVGDKLPEMPLFLEIGSYVQVPIEIAYQRAFEAVPAYWRGKVEGTSETITPSGP